MAIVSVCRDAKVAFLNSPTFIEDLVPKKKRKKKMTLKRFQQGGLIKKYH